MRIRQRRRKTAEKTKNQCGYVYISIVCIGVCINRRRLNELGGVGDLGAALL